MQLADFHFELPPELIARYPLPDRDGARMQVLRRGDGRVELAEVAALADYFAGDEVLVVNDTRVIPARLLGKKETGGQVEVLLVRRAEGAEERWRCLLRASKRPRAGQRLSFPAGITATVTAAHDPEQTEICFDCDDFAARLDAAGRIPLPPYLGRSDEPLDRERYQTVFAAEPGAVAAPTAGLHFTPELLARLQAKGVTIVPLTLHVGPGTFLPVRVDAISAHRMHREWYRIPAPTAAAINQAKGAGRRVVAVGTTTTRALEHAALSTGTVMAGEGESDLFITPGFTFRVIDALVTNFHLPCSTLLMLVSALAGRERVLDAYRQAVAARLRFFSYGDCMLVL